ncbi:MAG TPA: glycosyl transferase family 1, partial [Opitutus sp.]|nr:glycosyl transferase family 1 [Opitutus sp.]
MTAAADRTGATAANAPAVVLAHPLGNQFFRQLALALQRDGRLAEACTCIDWRPGIVARMLPRRLAEELGRRDFSTALGIPVAAHPWREWGRLLAGRAGWTALTRHETGAFSVDAVQRDFDAWVAKRIERRGGEGTIYAYEDAAEASFDAAARIGWRKVYDLPIAYWETSHRLLAEEAQRWPAWEATLESTRNSPAKLARKTRELELADLVVCPSRFVAD